MASKILSCKPSGPVIRKDICRFWPVWGSCLFVWILSLPVPLLNLRSASYGSRVDLAAAAAETILSSGQSFSLAMAILYGGVAAAAVWSFLFSARSVTLFHALPVGRCGMFLSHLLGGLGPLWYVHGLTALLAWLAQAELGLWSPAAILQWLAAVCLQDLLFFSIAVLCAMLTGNLPAMAVLYGLLNACAVGLESLLEHFACRFYYGVAAIPHRLTFLSPAGWLFTSYPVVGTQPVGAEALLLRPLCFYGLAALGMLGLSLILYLHRASETAGDVIAVPAVRPLAKYSFALGCALGLGALFRLILIPGETGLLPVLLCILGGGTVGYFAAEMLLRKSFRVFGWKKGGGMRGFLGFSAAMVLLMLCLHQDVFGIEDQLPDRDSIVQVAISCNHEYTIPGTDPAIGEVLALHQNVLDHKDEILSSNSTQCYFRLTYTLDDGSQLSRSYSALTGPQAQADPNSPARKLDGILSQPRLLDQALLPAENARLDHITLYLNFIDLVGPRYSSQALSGYCELADDELEPIISALRADLYAGDIGKSVLFGSQGAVQQLSLDVSSTLPGVDETQWNWIDLNDQDAAPRTRALLVHWGYLKEVQP